MATPGDVPASGVEVRLLQSDDPDLTPAQHALAGGADVVTLRWGWGPDQRALDPDVTEFRIYHHGSALTALDVTPNGTPSAAGTGWSLPVHFSRPVAANEFAGVRVVLGAAYQVLAHPAGVDVILDLGANPVDPARAPSQQPFVLTRTTSAELDPEYWDERIRVVPRVPAAAGSDAVEEYRETVPASWVAVAADTPRQRAAYGVTAADAESYVPDRRSAVEPAPRPGNESTVAATEVTARYYDRPTLVVADLADVPAVTLPRQSADDVRGRLRPADYLPPGFVAAPRMLLERLPAPAVLPRIRIEPWSHLARRRRWHGQPLGALPGGRAGLASRSGSRADAGPVLRPRRRHARRPRPPLPSHWASSTRLRRSRTPSRTGRRAGSTACEPSTRWHGPRPQARCLRSSCTSPRRPAR